MYQSLKTAIRQVERLLLVICGSLLTAMVAVMLLLVFTRNFLDFSYSWAEEITRYMMVWLVFLGAAVLVSQDDHIALDLLPNTLPPRGREALKLLVHTLILGTLLLLLQQSLQILDSRGASFSPSLGLSMRWVYAAIPVGAFLMVLLTVFRIVICLRVLSGRQV